MPTVSGVTDGKTPYGGMSIAMMSLDNANTQSSGSISGGGSWRWSLTWDYNSGFTGINWSDENTLGVSVSPENIDRWIYTYNMGSAFAQSLVAKGGYSDCATYEISHS